MANLYKIEKEYKEFILGLTPEEITEYYKQLNKKIIECYPTLNSNWKEEELESLLASVNDVTNILSSNYKKDSLNRTNIASRYLELSNKYLNEIDVASIKLQLANLKTIVFIIGMVVNGVEYFLSSIYSNWRKNNLLGTYILEEELGLPEEVAESIKEYSENSSSYYGASTISYINSFIEAEVLSMENYISFFKTTYTEIVFSEDVNEEDISEELASVVAEFNKKYKEGLTIIDSFEELKLNPFKTAIKTFVEVMKNTESKTSFIEHDYKAIYESYLASAPSYNFETFELILPTAEVDPTNRSC